MIISHRHKFIYLRTEKTGSTALEAALLEAVEGQEDVKGYMTTAISRRLPRTFGGLKRHIPHVFGLHVHASAKHIRSILGKQIFDSYFKFAVERNPWDRQVSLYNHRLAKRGQEDVSGFDAAMQSRTYSLMHHNKLKNWHVYSIGNEVVADQVLDYHRLQEDLPALAAKIGLPDLSLKRRNAHGGQRPHYSTFYSDHSRDLVGRWYSNEIEHFGFTFEDRRGEGSVASEPLIQATR